MFEIFTCPYVSNSMVVLAIILGIITSGYITARVVRNHLKYHVFRPIMAGWALFLLINAMSNAYILYHWRESSECLEHFIVASLILFSYLALSSTLLFVNKNIFEKAEEVKK